METKRAIDGFGASALIGFAALLAINQVVIKVTGSGFGPVFQAALRSVGATLFLLFWMNMRGHPVRFKRESFIWGVLAGILFAAEFICLYVALDLTTVSRASIIFYSMPVWLALAGHVMLPGERLTPLRALGLGFAMCGVILAIAHRGDGQSSLLGDVLALAAALGWAGIALMLRLTPLSRMRPEMALFYQVAVSAVILLAVAPLFGDLVRDVQLIHLASLAFQSICVVGLGFMLWFWLLTQYRTNAVASFAFLSPVLAVLFGWMLLGEQVGPQIWGALALVAAGIILINRR